MTKILIMYYSRTGNTERMARAVAEGAGMIPGVEVWLRFSTTPEDLACSDGLAVGVPTYHHDMTLDTKRLFEEAAVKNLSLRGKVGAAFGSYGWSGEAPRLVLEIMKNKFEMRVIEPPLLAKYAPDDTGLQRCREFGRKIAETCL